MDQDIDELVGCAGLTDPPWTRTYDSWPDRYRPGERIRCWFWTRPLATA